MTAEVKSKNDINILRAVAWIILIVCGVFALAILFAQGIQPQSIGATEPNPAGIMFGLMVAFGGIAVCALLLTICTIAQTLLDIKKELIKGNTAAGSNSMEGKSLSASNG